MPSGGGSGVNVCPGGRHEHPSPEPGIVQSCRRVAKDCQDIPEIDVVRVRPVPEQLIGRVGRNGLLRLEVAEAGVRQHKCQGFAGA